MLKRFLSIVLAFTVTFSGIIPISAAKRNDVTVYLSVSKYGEIVRDTNGELMAYVEVSLNGKDSYNLDDVFQKAHDLYCKYGDKGYSSSESEWGFGIDKFWGNTSGDFGYQVNGGTEAVMGLGHLVEDGDYIDMAIYKNSYPDTEGYSMFDLTKAEIYTDTEFELTLNYFSGYDENWNNIVSPCEGAQITVNGEETEFVTDENGNVVLSFETDGKKIISATKKKVVSEVEVPAITAPVCIVDVKSRAVEIMHNIASGYKDSDFSEDNVNLPWIIADMMMYEELFPESENNLSDSQKQDALESMVSFAEKVEKPGDLAKSIIALRSLGYDARRIYTEDFEKIDLVEKLAELVDSENDAVTNVYTLPYVLIALSQGEDYISADQLDYLISAALENKEIWQNTEYGTDALTPMVFALALYSDRNNEIEAVLEESVGILESEQREDGLIDGFEGYEAASTGLAICAVSSVEIDAKTVKNPEINLIDGLISTLNSEENGFSNEFATEQGFRGLLGWRYLTEDAGKGIYNFYDYSMQETNLTGFEYCPVSFDVSPKKAEVTIKKQDAISDNCFDLLEGKYSYSVSAAGYKTEKGEFEISEEDAKNHILKNIEISLEKKKSEGSSGKVSVSTEIENDKEELPKEEEQITEPPVSTETPVLTEPTEPQVPELPVNKVFTEDTFKDVNSDDWYYQSVKFVYEKDIFDGTDIGFEPNKPMTRAMLVTVLHRLDSSNEEYESNTFSDVSEDKWYYQSINWANENKIVNGMSEDIFDPDRAITREQLAVILYRYALYKGYNVKMAEIIALPYNDNDKISDYALEAIKFVTSAKLVYGRDTNEFDPKASATRAEVATIIMRFFEVNK